MKQKRRTIKLKPVPANCPFCKTKTEPDYKNYQEISKFITERGKILGKARTGVCTKHQRRIAIAIKRARHLALLPFTGALQ